jgi:pimeloyl-ACP methyl ester carboxylesterase
VKRVIAIASAVGVVIAGAVAAVPAVAATSAPASSAVKAGAIKWKACSIPWGSGSFKAQCGMLSVPLNYSHPHGTKIQLAVSRVPHTTKNYQGVMLTNPGGPGGSGLNLSGLYQDVPNNAGASYDWIGFDPRGVGASLPSISCIPTYFHYNRPNYIPSTKALQNTWLGLSKGYDKACAAKNGHALLSNMTTIDAAKDMDSIRAALGVKQINYYGYSYGTYLGQVYSSLYPKRVRRMVLDSNVDPRGVWYKANLAQDIAFNANIKRYFAWLAKNNSSYHLGTTEAGIEKAWYAERNKLAKHPLGGKIGPDEWTDLALQAGYYVYGWDEIAHGLWEAYNQPNAAQTLTDLEGLYNQADDPTDDNEFAVYNAVQCTDVQWPTSWAKWKRDNDAVNKQSPFETWDNAWFNAPCLHWPAAAHTPTKINGSKVKSVLLIDEQYDAATPYEGTLYIRKLYPHASMIEGVGGTTHAGSLSGALCEDDAVAAYLSKGTVPARKKGPGPDLKCAPVQPPTPTPVTAAANATARPATAQGRTLPLITRP